MIADVEDEHPVKLPLKVKLGLDPGLSAIWAVPTVEFLMDHTVPIAGAMGD